MDENSMSNAQLFEMYQLERQRANDFRRVLENWVKTTPTDQSGKFDLINQPQAYAASIVLAHYDGKAPT